VDARSTSDGLLELDHRLDALVEDDHLAGFCVHARREQFRGRHNYRIPLLRVDEVVEVLLTALATARDSDDELRRVAGLGGDLPRHFVHERRPHALRVVDILTEHDRLAVGVGPDEVGDDPFGDPFCALVEDQHSVHVALVVDAVLNLLTEVVRHPLGRPPALQVFVEVDADDLVGGEEAIVDALLERVRVDRRANVGERGGLASLLRRGRQAQLDGGRKMVEDVTPRAVFRGAAPVALVDDHEVKNLAELLVHLFSSSSP
jgi:hypothetical protein